MTNVIERVAKHSQINWKNLSIPRVPNPPFLIFFVNSLCNMKCEHCFYWQQLNQKTDMTFEQIETLSNDMGHIEYLNLSGGEPFLRKEFAEICKMFIKNNGVREIYVPTNGFFEARTVKALKSVLKDKSLRTIGIEISLDGMPKYHDEFRKTRYSFFKAMETYKALEKLQKEDPRLRIYCISTATEENMEEIKALTTYLYDNCPNMDHHHLAIIRGDRKNPTLSGPKMDEYRELYSYVRQVWAKREEQRSGSIVEPMLQWVKCKTAEEKRQIVPCRAGVLSVVVHANGDLAVCEQHPPIGNLKETPFQELWHGARTTELRKSIKAKECYCTNEIFMWPSIVFQPQHLVKTMFNAKVWNKYSPPADAHRVDYAKKAGEMEIPHGAIPDEY